jgi:flagellar biosynthetic protein FliP
MGLFLLPPALVSLPLKLALFAIADGWMLTAGMLLRSFGSA